MGTPNGARRWPRTAIAAAAVLLVAASAAIGYRVFAPAEVVTPARAGYPAAATARPGVVGTLNAAPLIVDDRLRVYATTRKVWADRPVGAKTRRTPYWSYRRWPAQVAGVLADGATVVTRWSDGRVVALDARTGRVRWRAAGPVPGHGYAGRRTGAATVYAPAGLHTAGTPDGRRVLLVTGAAERIGIELSSGRRLWRVATDPTCRGEGLTTPGGQFVTVDTCATPQAVEFHDVATGALSTRWRPERAGPAVELTPLGCAAGRSGCPAIRTSSGGATLGWLVRGARPVPAPALDGPATVLVGDAALRLEGGQLVARSARTGTELWRRAGVGAARLLAVQPGRVHLGTEDGDLLTLDSATGAERSRFPFTHGRDSTDWSPGFVHAANGFVAAERLAEPVDPDAEDRRYYLAAQPVILAGT